MDNAALRHVGAMCEAMLLQQCLKPLAQSSDALGDYGIGLVAETIAERDHGGFGALLAARLEHHA